ncbi:MAG: squalene/phytoene synthase family protein [Alphaproteobacteria bacterium]
MKNNDNQHYCSNLAQKNLPDLFLASLFVPPDARRELHVIYAFAAEIAAVKSAVTEELLAHIRYAWWEESLASARAHPVLESLAPLIEQGHVSAEALIKLIDLHRSHYPEAPPSEAMLYKLSEALLQAAHPAALQGFKKGVGVIQKHRQAHGGGSNGWLYLKLLARGVF